jgi:hypothetical protein
MILKIHLRPAKPEGVGMGPKYCHFEQRLVTQSMRITTCVIDSRLYLYFRSGVEVNKCEAHKPKPGKGCSYLPSANSVLSLLLFLMYILVNCHNILGE